MRIIHLFFAVLLAGWAAPASAQPSSEAAEAERVVQAYHDAFNRQDLAGVLTVFARDVVVRQFPADTVARGVDELRRAHKDQFGTLPAVRVEVRARSVEGQTVVEEVVYHGLPCNQAYAERVEFLVAAGRIRTVTITPLSDLVGSQNVGAEPVCFPPDDSDSSP